VELPHTNAKDVKTVLPFLCGMQNRTKLRAITAWVSTTNAGGHGGQTQMMVVGSTDIAPASTCAICCVLACLQVTYGLQPVMRSNEIGW
jgi:hypothetical protein